MDNVINSFIYNVNYINNIELKLFVLIYNMKNKNIL